MASTQKVRELFVIHQSGLPIGHLGTGHVQIDDALFGGLLSAIENVGLSLGLEDDGALDSIRFRAYDLVYARTANSLIVLLTNDGSPEFFARAKVELLAIGEAIESRGYLTDIIERSASMVADVDAIITSKAVTIFARQDDIFLWDDNHTFQLAGHRNERWKGQKLFSNYLMLSPLQKTLRMPMDDLVRMCDMMEEMRRPSEIINDPDVKTKDNITIRETMRFLHMYGVIHCFGTTIHRGD